MMNSIVVYTAIFGDRDLLQTPIKFKGITYVCFTDNPSLMSDVWTIVYVPATEEHPRRQAKIYKVCPHLYFADYTYSVWVDATHTPLIHPAEMIKKYLKDDDLALFIHKKRKCIYEEAEECIDLGLDDTQIIKKQILKYKSAGYPEKNGLATCTVIFRKHNEAKVKEAMEKWWAEIQNHSMRDQISFNFIMHTLQLSYYAINLDVYKNSLFKRYFHIGTPEFYMKIEEFELIKKYKPVKKRLRKFQNRRFLRTLLVFDKYIGLMGIYIKTLSPKLYIFIKTKMKSS